MKKIKQHTIILLLIVLLVSVMVLSCALGAYDLSIAEVVASVTNALGISDVEVKGASETIFWHIRLPRVVFSVMIGAALSVSGAGLQGLFRNPLADPGLVGISAGAILFASLYIVFIGKVTQQMLGSFGLPLVTFMGATLATYIVFRLAKSGNQTNVATMLLAGIAINALCGAGTGLLIFLSADDELRDITFWTLGSLGAASWTVVFTVLPFVLVAIVFIPSMAKKLDAYTLGEQDAACLGINVQKFKITLVLLLALAVAACVAFAGTIGFVGLVVPHIIRLTFGSQHKGVFVLSALLGSILLCLADLVCRTIVVPAELPIGILTAILGTPMFLYLLLDQNKKSKAYV